MYSLAGIHAFFDRLACSLKRDMLFIFYRLAIKIAVASAVAGTYTFTAAVMMMAHAAVSVAVHAAGKLRFGA